MTFSTSKQINANDNLNQSALTTTGFIFKNVETEHRELIILILELLVLIALAVILVFFPIQVMIPYIASLMALVIYFVWI